MAFKQNINNNSIKNIFSKLFKVLIDFLQWFKICVSWLARIRKCKVCNYSIPEDDKSWVASLDQELFFKYKLSSVF